MFYPKKNFPRHRNFIKSQFLLSCFHISTEAQKSPLLIFHRKQIMSMTESTRFSHKITVSDKNYPDEYRNITCNSKTIHNSHISVQTSHKISTIPNNQSNTYRVRVIYAYIRVLITKSRMHIRLEPLTLSKRFVQAWILTF